MSKFNVGDVVVCMVSDDSFDTLETGRSYTVKSSEDWTVELEEMPHRDFGCARFEHIEEWAKHQKPVSVDVELQLAREQINMLQQANATLTAQLEEARSTIVNVYYGEEK